MKMPAKKKTTISRSIVNLLNRFASVAKLVVLSKKEHSSLYNSAAIEKLTCESNFIALAGTISVFANYITLREVENFSIARLAEYLQHPHLLAEKVTDIASNRSQGIDDFMRYYAKHFHESNSQWTQDIFVSYSLQRKNSGTYFEVGGADGITHSNTLNLEKLFGWSGTLVEPHPMQFELLKMTRSQQRNKILNCALMPQKTNGIVNLKDAWQLSAVEALSGHDLHETARNSSNVTYRVESRSFEDVFMESGPLDYLSLDVEGPEFELLDSINWVNATLPSVITVEHNWRIETASKIRALLTPLGYREPFVDYPWLTRGDLWLTRL